MSMRNVRKIFGPTNTLPPLEGNSDEEFEPLYAKETKSKFTYEGLEFSSNSGTEEEAPETVEEATSTAEKTKKKKKNRKKNRRPKPETPNDPELDEIDKSVREVNAQLGPPPEPSSSNSKEKKPDPRKVLLSVTSKHLDYNNELKRIFGTESLDENARGKKYRPHNVVKYRRATIVPIPENKQYHSVGLSMSLHRRGNGLSFFTFDHNREYQKIQQSFLVVLAQTGDLPQNVAHVHHIEGLLETADFMFRAEEYTAAHNLLESIISYLHYVAHPYFNLTDQSVRLEYKYMENRPFFIAVLKYLHMLTNKACHRTALELAKLLLNLDPSDPLAIIYVIDVIALRAREHQWLIDVIQYWSKERDAEYLFNMQYSNALAHFHIAKKSGDYKRADELVQHAMLLYPTMASRIFEYCKHDPSLTIRKHPYFDVADENKFPEKIRTAMILHAKLVCWRWREPPAMDWFFRNAQELVKKLDEDPETQARSKTLSKQRYQLLAGCPDEIHRHLHVVRAMSNLLVEWELPQMSRQRACDPLPPKDGINRYGYGLAYGLDARLYGILNTLI